MSKPKQPNSEIIAAYLDAVIRKDTSAIDRFFAPHVEYMVNGTSSPDPDGILPPISVDCRDALPWLGVHRGREAAREFLAHMHRNLEVIAFGPREVISEGNKAAAFGWFRLHALPTGRMVDISYSIRIELQGGLIVKYHFLENTFDVAAAFHVGGQWSLETDGAKRHVPSWRARNFSEDQVPITNAVSTSLSIQQFTSSEPGAWSNSYLITGGSEAILFDVPMLHSDAEQIADGITRSRKNLKTVMISHAHPDHFMGLDVITERFPKVRVVSTQNVIADIKTDGPWIFSMLRDKLGLEGPTRLVIPDALTEQDLTIEGIELEVVEFGESESKHMAAVHISGLKALLSADLVYNQAHLYLQEKRLESWLARLDELETYAKNRVTAVHPGHGKPAGLELIGQTRTYLCDFAEALRSGNARSVEQAMLSKYPDYHVKQFLTAFSIPAYFPST